MIIDGKVNFNTTLDECVKATHDTAGRMIVPDSSQRAKAGLRLLAVDDDDEFLQAFKLWLERYDDAEVLTATNGRDALDVIDSTFDVLICDRRMPDMTGDEVIAQLNQGGYDIRTIVISAFEPDDSLQKDDADLYLQKPIDREEIFEALNQVLSD